MKEKLLISACLCGQNTKYNGKNNLIDRIEELKNHFEFILICPEVMGGLSTPRNPSEIKGDKIVSNQGKDVTMEFTKGASKAKEIVLNQNIKYALLKEASPSCGVHQVYDGTFSGTKIFGQGITTKLLLEQGVLVFNECEVDQLLNLVE
ncbi:MAG: DUF523 domain-containing protein [Anaeroplasmataceae bacterium]|nr:DUF523 domain-containing protein [Anaeroplasmataceae bacterium]